MRTTQQLTPFEGTPKHRPKMHCKAWPLLYSALLATWEPSCNVRFTKRSTKFTVKAGLCIKYFFKLHVAQPYFFRLNPKRLARNWQVDWYQIKFQKSKGLYLLIIFPQRRTKNNDVTWTLIHYKSTLLTFFSKKAGCPFSGHTVWGIYAVKEKVVFLIRIDCLCAKLPDNIPQVGASLRQYLDQHQKLLWKPSKCHDGDQYSCHQMRREHWTRLPKVFVRYSYITRKIRILVGDLFWYSGKILSSVLHLKFAGSARSQMTRSAWCP